ncbi:MAG: hypothetical protein ACOX88_06185 [Christensenellales bacterium]|jgi:hypothetical protein
MSAKTIRSYEDSVHYQGRLWMLGAAIIMIAFPLAVCVYYNAWPPLAGLLKGFLGIAPLFWTVGIIEIFTYVPMMGAAGSYLGFVTGNLANLKVPCTLNAMQRTGVKPGTQEGEIISTLSIAISSLVNTVIIIIGVILIVPLTPILQNEVLAPAFDSILPALFGALAVVFVAKNWKIAVAPLVIMAALFIAVPALSRAVGVLVPIGALIAIAAARVLYKTNKL